MQRAMIRRVKDENDCAGTGGFVRIFPTEHSWPRYKRFVEDRQHNNQILNRALYPNQRAPVQKKQAYGNAHVVTTDLIDRMGRCVIRSDIYI